MENGPFIDDFPIKTSIYNGFSIAMLVITRGCIQRWGSPFPTSNSHPPLLNAAAAESRAIWAENLVAVNDSNNFLGNMYPLVNVYIAIDNQPS